MKALENIIFLPIILMSLASGILLVGITLYIYIFYFDRQRLYGSIALLGIAGFVFIGSEIFVISLGITGNAELGRQFHRIEALSAAFYIFALPFFISSFLDLTHSLQKITRWSYLAGLVVAIVIAAAAFIKPELFLSLTRDPLSLVTPWNIGRGTPGPLYRVRDACIFLMCIYSIALLIHEIVVKKVRIHVLLTLIGSFFGVASGIIDLTLARQEMPRGLFTIRIFSYFGFGMTIFIMFAMLGIMKRYISQARDIERSRKIESLGVMAGGIAHDFNNILTGILGNSSLLKETKGLGENQITLINEIEKASSRAKKLSYQLLTFAKGGSPVKNIASLRELVTETVGFVLRGSNIQVKYSFPENIWNAHIDENQISQVIQNIILNSKDAMPCGGCIEIEAKNTTLSADNHSLEAGDYVTLSIKDDGCGIPQDNMMRIFDPYFSTKNSGSGLGLAICWSIVTRHGGHIAAYSKPGDGALFSIYLPAVKEERAPVQDNAGAVPVPRGKILFMDDDESIRMLAVQMLNKMQLSYEITDNGLSAVEAYSRAFTLGAPFDLVILDLTVPGSMGGKEALSEIRKINPSAQAIIISGYAEDDYIASITLNGSDCFIQKPFSYNEIYHAISRAMA